MQQSKNKLYCTLSKLFTPLSPFLLLLLLKCD